MAKAPAHPSPAIWLGTPLKAARSMLAKALTCDHAVWDRWKIGVVPFCRLPMAR
ncbi:hypothetical protein GFS31_05690 [Leptolyngbya sp. BL0902]|nr:hypothetical protein GFS31_05690 [Leptolyngbya sp. BL0902]